MKAPCPRYEPELSAYIDGETPPAVRAEIEAHLPTCAGCRAAVSRLSGVSRVLRRWDAHETRYAASAGFRNRVLTEVGGSARGPATGSAWRAAAAVGFVAVGAAGFALVAPRLAARGDDPRIAGLESELKQMRDAVAARTDVPRSAAPRAAEAPVERLPPFAPVVVEPEADDDSAPTAATIPDDYEQRGDRRVLREALPDHDDYNRERGTLVLQEQMAKAIEDARTPPAPERTTSAPPTPALATFLGEVRVAAREDKPYRQVQVWPIEATAGRGETSANRLVGTERAVHDDVLRVTESPVRGQVVAENRDARRAVLVLAGDVLAGGRQDRVARSDVLVEPGRPISIPTYTCGRERRTSYVSFRTGGVAPPGLRALIGADRALLAGGLGQDRFDMSVADTVKALASPGPSGSLDKIFTNDALAADTKKYVDFFEKRLDAGNVVGLAVSAGSRLLGVEVFGDHATFVEHRARIVRSYVLAALAASPDGTRLEGAPPSRESVTAVLAAAPSCTFHDDLPTGAGTQSVFRSVAGAVFGYGLLDGDHAVHAVMFTAVPDYPEPTRGHGRPAGEGGTAADAGAGDGQHPAGREAGSSSEGADAK